MPDLILVNAENFETRVALIENGGLSEIFIERESRKGMVGNIYKGKVIRVLPGMQSAFVEIGLKRTAFLYVSEISQIESGVFQDEIDLEMDQKEPRKYFPGEIQIQDLVKEGQEILAQVLREPIGDKGAQITTYISLPGRYLVYMPEVRQIGVSRKIENEKDRIRLRRLVDGLRPESAGGFIIRTACGRAGDDEIKAELDYLISLWGGLREKALKSAVPSLVYQEPALELMVIREYLTPQTSKIIVDHPESFARIRDFLKRTSPRQEGMVELWTGKEPVFEHFGVELELDKALTKRVWLKSGGYIVIDETEALATVDVNTGKYIGARDFEDTILKTNLEASREIVSQLRLRNIGGIIIIDFIDMNRIKNREKVINLLQEELKKDKAKSVVIRISEIGLTEMTRKRSAESLTKKMCAPCPYCEGKGYLKSGRTIAYEIYRDLVKNKGELAGKTVKLYINSQVAELLLGEEKRLLEQLEQKSQIRVQMEIQYNFHQEQYEYSVVEDGTAKPGG